MHVFSLKEKENICTQKVGFFKNKTLQFWASTAFTSSIFYHGRNLPFKVYSVEKYSIFCHLRKDDFTTHYELRERQRKSQVFLAQQDLCTLYLSRLVSSELWYLNPKHSAVQPIVSPECPFAAHLAVPLQPAGSALPDHSFWDLTEEEHVIPLEPGKYFSTSMQYLKVFINTVVFCIRPISLIRQLFCFLGEVLSLFCHTVYETNLVGPEIVTHFINRNKVLQGTLSAFTHFWAEK